MKIFALIRPMKLEWTVSCHRLHALSVPCVIFMLALFSSHDPLTCAITFLYRIKQWNVTYECWRTCAAVHQPVKRKTSDMIMYVSDSQLYLKSMNMHNE